MYSTLNGPAVKKGADVRKNKYKIMAGVYSEYRRLSLDAMHRVVRTVLLDAVQGRRISACNR
jgi:hypothetical protein